MSPDAVYVIGASGHGKVVAGALRDQGFYVAGFVEDAMVVGVRFFGSEVVCCLKDICTVTPFPMMIGIGDNTTRRRVDIEFQRRLKNVVWQSAVHSRAYAAPTSRVDLGTLVAAGAIITEDAVIGRHCIINTNASVDHDCVLADYVHVACGATLSGNVHVGEGAFIGAGATILQGIRIGEWSTVGAGATVTKDVPKSATVIGTPAKVRKPG